MMKLMVSSYSPNQWKYSIVNQDKTINVILHDVLLRSFKEKFQNLFNTLKCIDFFWF